MKTDAPKSAGLELGETKLRELVHQSTLDSTEWRARAEGALLNGEPLPGADDELTRALIAEPHFMGWLHQHLVEEGRLEAFDAHHQREAKHRDSTTTTQLYTPRWVADRLAREVMDLSGPSATCLDPACGGGQMLIAWIDEACRRGVRPEDAFLSVRGVDLDPSAVEAGRIVLRTHAIRLLGDVPEAVESHIQNSIVVGDGLFDSLETADVILMNPPYMGSRSMPAELKSRIRSEFEPFHLDLYTAFIERAARLATQAIGVLAQQTIWYLSRYRKARASLLERGSLVFFGHLGPGVFASLSGEKASVVAFVYSKDAEGDESARFVDLRKASRDEMALNFVSDEGKARSITDFAEIPGTPIAHWLEPELTARFGDARLGDSFEIPGGQNKTGKNRRYVRRWDEVDDLHPTEMICDRTGTGRWRFYSKGGPFAPWWGNWKWVVDWSEKAREFYRENKTSNLVDEVWVERPGVVYSDFGGRRFAARYKPAGVVFDMTGPAIFAPDDDPDLIFGIMVLLNSTPVRKMLNAMNPSLHYQVRDLRNVPLFDGWRETMAEASQAGRQLVDAYRDLHRSVEGDPLYDGSKTARSAPLRELELAWNDRMSRAYGVASSEPPFHHVVSGR